MDFEKDFENYLKDFESKLKLFKEIYKETISVTTKIFGDLFYKVKINDENFKGLVVFPLWRLLNIPYIPFRLQKVSVGGIMIKDENDKNIDLLEIFSNIYINIDIDPKAVNLSLSRDSIIEDERFERLKKKLVDIVMRDFKGMIDKYSDRIRDIYGEENVNVFFRMFINVHPWELQKYRSALDIFKKRYRTLVLKDNELKYVRFEDFLKPENNIYVLVVSSTLEDPLNYLGVFGVFSDDPLFNYYLKIFKKKVDNFDGVIILNWYSFVVLKSIGVKIYEIPIFDVEIVEDAYLNNNCNNCYEITKISIKPVKFLNPKTLKLFELWYSRHRRLYILLNVDHEFVKLLLKAGDNLKQINHLLEDFFEKIDYLARSEKESDKELLFNKIVSIQRQILEWLAEKGYIENDEIEKYVLTKDDFPEYIFKS